MIKTLPAECARELLYAKSVGGVQRVTITDDDTSRWTSYHSLVVTFDDEPGKFFMALYEQGLTESQDIQPFEDELEVTFREVEPYQVTTTAYRTKV